MILTNLKRVIKHGSIGFYRNRTISLSSIFVMTVTLSIIGIIFFAKGLLTHTLSQLQNKVDINVTFTLSAAEESILELKKIIETLPEVQTVEYLSREQVLEDFKERHKNDALSLRSLEEIGGNPFGASLLVKAQNPGQYESIARFLEGTSGTLEGANGLVDHINYYNNKEIIDRLVSLIDGINRIAYIAAVFFIFVSIMITYNTMRLAIYAFRDEIAVMRLVGADRFYVRGPFVVEGMIYGAVSAVLALLIFWPASYFVAERTTLFFGGFSAYAHYMSNIFMLFGLFLVTGVVLGAIASYLAVRKYLQQ